MLDPSEATWRTLVHVLAAAVWLGGQVAVAGFLPGLTGRWAEGSRWLVRRAAAVLWPAFAVLVASGVWSVVAVDVADTTTAYQVTLFLKILAAALAAVATLLASIAPSQVGLAVWGALATAGSLVAFALGVLLDTGS